MKMLLGVFIIGLMAGAGVVDAGTKTDVADVLDRIRGHDFEKNSGYSGVGDLEDQGWRVRTLAVRDLVRLGSDAGASLIASLEDSNRHVRDISAMVLGILKVESAREALKKIAVNDDSPVARVEAIEALSKIGGRGINKFIQERHKEDAHRDVRNRCKVAAGRLEKGMTVSPELADAYASLDESDFRRAKVGDPAPEFALKDTTGKVWKLSDFKGVKPVALVWIFAEWCPVCLGEFHDLGKMKDAYAKAGVQVMTVECHDMYRCQAMVGKRDIWWPHLVDMAGKVGLRYGVDHMEFTVHSDWINRPCTFIIDKEGILRFAYYGTFWGDRPTIEQTLEMILAKKFEFEHPERRK